MSSMIGSVDTVLITTGDQAIATVGESLSDLALGQIGIFDAETNLAIDGSGANRKFYLALATTKDGKREYVKTEVITAADVESYNTRCASAPREGVYDLVVDGCSNCSEDYVLKFNITSPSDFYKMGYQPLYKSFVVDKDCCTNCADCDNEGAICREVIKKLLTEGADFTAGTSNAATATSLASAIDGVSGYSASADGNVVTVTADTAGVAGNAIAFETNATTGVSITGSGFLIGGSDADADNCPALRVQTVLPTIKDWCGIPETYDFPRNIKMVASPTQGLACCGTVTERQVPTLEEGSWQEVKFREYEAKGHEDGPYRQTKSGVFLGGSLNTVESTDYNSIDIQYRYTHYSGNLRYSDPKMASIFMPCASSTTSSEIAAALDQLLSSFDAKAGDLALCACDATDLTVDKSAATDGIG